jgi:hypothetical protein
MTNPNHMLTDVNNVITPAYNAKDHPKTTVFLVTEEPNSSTEKVQVDVFQLGVSKEIGTKLINTQVILVPKVLKKPILPTSAKKS